MEKEVINYSFADTPFGEVLVAATGKGVCALFFTDGTDSRGGADSREGALTELNKLFPGAVLSELMTPLLKKAANFDAVPLDMRGTPFQIEVWHALTEIPKGKLTTYSEIAGQVGRPRACRAVGMAVGANPVSVIVPCHRVLRNGGGLGGYRWGLERKQRLLDYELAQGRACSSHTGERSKESPCNGRGWREEYRDRIVSVEEAVGRISDGGWVVCAHAAANPQLVMRELVAQKKRFGNLHIFHVLPMGFGDYLLPENAAHFHHVTTFTGGTSRAAINEGKADFLPCFFRDVPGLLGAEVPVDVAIVNVSPPDAEGFCSLGLSCDYTARAVELAGEVIAQVNECMPRVGGRANAVHISRFDAIVPCADPMPELPAAAISVTEREIGRHCASIVKNGDTLQLGIGAIPDAVLGFLGDRKNLGLHSEMISDGAVELIRAGVIDGSRKTLHLGKAAVSFLIGSRTLYDFVDGNPDIEMLPVDYVNDPNVIAQNDNMVSINSCMEVDLTGQVNAESIGLIQFSGVGGQVDFVRGARMSHGGRSIIAMPSTASGGKLSRIVPVLSPGAAVTTSRNDVDYIVTEHGVAKLRGCTLRERARALIAIAHPDFRAALTEEFNQRFPI